MRFTEFKLFESIVIDVPSGRTGIEVADVQKALVALGYSLPKHGVDGIRGPETSRAVTQFQTDNGLEVDGDPGPNTVAKLNDIIKQKNISFTKSTEADVKRTGTQASEINTAAIQDPDFKKKVDKVAAALGISSNNLMAIMKQESGVNPQARNRTSRATGLIQFMPDTARMLGTTIDELYQMDGVQQLDYVYKYFKMTGVGDGSLGELYTAVFMPKYVGYPKDTVLGQRGAPGFSGKVYAQNSGLDRNQDGVITKADIENSVSRFA